MARAPFQVLVLPFRTDTAGTHFAIFKRADNGSWQGIAGGAEDNETPLETARRESLEEAGLPRGLTLIELSTTSSIPVIGFRGSVAWGDQVFVITEHCFGMATQGHEIRLSPEHTEFLWADYSEAMRLLRYDGNRTALWELNQRIHGLGPHEYVP